MFCFRTDVKLLSNKDKILLPHNHSHDILGTDLFLSYEMIKYNPAGILYSNAILSFTLT